VEQGLSITTESLSQLPRFSVFNSTLLEQVHKTGLGSSAALITALVGALLAYFELISLDDNPKKQMSMNRDKSLIFVHNVAQFCHSLAQRKIGSGFDITAAVYGSLIYRRFSSSLLEKAMEEVDDQGIAKITIKTINILVPESPEYQTWDHEFTSIDLPYGIYLLLGDVYSGTSSPSMASAVLKWKQEHLIEGRYDDILLECHLHSSLSSL
jgi:phosphomevalonate kinase